jgi:uncharacterized membrane protein YbhN (UPF0104 family)
MKDKLSKFLPIVLGVALLIICVTALHNELKHYSLKEIIDSLNNISLARKLTAIALTIVGYLVITFYDILAFVYIKKTLSLGKIIFTSFLSYAIGNTVGFTIFSGTAIRYRFYSSWDVSKLQIAKIIAFTHITFWLGILGVGGVVFVVDPLTLPNIIKLPFHSVHPLGITFLLIVAIYMIFTHYYHKPIHFQGEELTLPSVNLSLSLILISALDWGIAAAVLYLLLPGGTTLTYLGFFGIYILGLTAGIISNVPGGLGVFETVILFSLTSKMSTPNVLSALLAYRGIYYFLPLILASTLFAYSEFKKNK